MSDARSRPPWRGRWVSVEGPADPDVVLSVAARRGVDPSSVERELRGIEERFDVDTVYLSPNTAGRQ